MIELCARCRGGILPEQPRASFVSDMWRAPAKGMTKKPDPAAERIKRRKAAKEALRSIARGNSQETSEAVTLYLTTTQAAVPSEECEDCLKLQRGTRARFLGYDAATNRAYARIIPS